MARYSRAASDMDSDMRRGRSRGGCSSCCSKRCCLMTIIVLVLVVNVAFTAMASWWALENKEMNERQLFILNENYMRAEQEKFDMMANSTDVASNPKFFGEWQCFENENVKELLLALNAGWFKASLGAGIKPKVTLTQVPNTNIVTVKDYNSVTGERVTNFTIGEITQYQAAVGPVMKAIMTWSSGKMVTYFVEADSDKHPRKSGYINVRELLNDNEMMNTIKYKDVISKRWYRRIIKK